MSMSISERTTAALEKQAAATERLALANERIVEMADEERQANHQGGPAYCPHCNTMNPDVRAPAASGNMGEYILAATCDNCGKAFYGIPEGWIIVATREELEAGQA